MAKNEGYIDYRWLNPVGGGVGQALKTTSRGVAGGGAGGTRGRMPAGLAKAMNAKRIESMKEENDMLTQLLRQLKLGQQVSQIADEQGATLDAEMERQAMEAMAFGMPGPQGPTPQVRKATAGGGRYVGPSGFGGGTTAQFGPETVLADRGDFMTGAVGPFAGGAMYSELRDPLMDEVMAKLDTGLEFKRKSALAGQGLAPGIADEAQRAAIGKVQAEADSLHAQIKALEASTDLESKKLLLGAKQQLATLYTGLLKTETNPLTGQAYRMFDLDPTMAAKISADLPQLLSDISELATSVGAAPAASSAPSVSALDLAKKIKETPPSTETKVLRDDTGKIRAHVNKTLELVSSAMSKLPDVAAKLPAESVARIAQAIENPASFRKNEKPLSAEEKKVWRLLRNRGVMSGRREELSEAQLKARITDMLNEYSVEPAQGLVTSGAAQGGAQDWGWGNLKSFLAGYPFY